ncbi:hypothetical protein [Haloferula sp. BvORR071]|uniref:hypothetical protein n=1 Tax=Haloferula sp. BvORR071 TaxID=1396141 RepID=UPI002240EFDF|nr:hypothetical protein [Haloferula sp. BvORR071]
MVRFLLRSPLLWIGMLVAAYISWLWLKTTAKPMGFSYSRRDLQIVVALGSERFSLATGAASGLGAGTGFQLDFAPGKFGPAHYLWMQSLGRKGPVAFVGSSTYWGVSWSFQALLTGYLAVWYGFLGWRAWRYHRRHMVRVDDPVQPSADA